MTRTCHHCQQPGANVLGIRAAQARPDHRETWLPLHGECFEEAGFSYGIELDDLRARGWRFWVDHIAVKAWSQHTDYATAIPAMVR